MILKTFDFNACELYEPIYWFLDPKGSRISTKVFLFLLLSLFKISKALSICSRRKRAKHRKHEQATQTTTWRSSRFSHDSVLILFHLEHHQSMSLGYSDRPRDTSQSGDDYYTMRSSSVSPAGSIHVSSGSGARPGRADTGRRHPRGAMSQSWWLIIGRGKSRRCLPPQPRISRDAIGNTQLPPSSYIDYKDGRRHSKRKKEREWSRGRETAPMRRADGRTDRRADSGR